MPPEGYIQIVLIYVYANDVLCYKRINMFQTISSGHPKNDTTFRLKFMKVLSCRKAQKFQLTHSRMGHMFLIVCQWYFRPGIWHFTHTIKFKITGNVWL